MTSSTSLQAFVGLFTLTKKRSEAYADADVTVSLLGMSSPIHKHAICPTFFFLSWLHLSLPGTWILGAAPKDLLSCL